MSKYNKVIEILESENFAPRIETETFKENSWDLLKWNINDDECFVFEGDIALDNNNIAWFQTSERDNHLLRVIQNNEKFEWTPKTYNPIFGCDCIHIEWNNEHVLFIYQEKHDLYVCSIKNSEIKTFCVEGAELERKGNTLAYETFQNRLENHVRLIELPSLKELEPITKEEAKKRELYPQGLNRPDGFLNVTE